MNYKVSYIHAWGENGTHYNQRITFTMALYELCTKFNNSIINECRRLKDHRDLKSIYFKPLAEGKNYVTLSLRDFIVKKFCNPNDKRIKDRNTIIVVKIKNDYGKSDYYSL